MSDRDFKAFPRELPRIPSLQELATTVVNNHAECREGVEITDSILDEINMKLTFLLRTIHISAPVNAGLAGPDGKVQTVRKSAEQVYQEVGRAALIQEREAKRAASLQAIQEQASTGRAPAADETAEGHTPAEAVAAGVTKH